MSDDLTEYYKTHAAPNPFGNVCSYYNGHSQTVCIIRVYGSDLCLMHKNDKSNDDLKYKI